jgi:hypothetical protein
MCVCVYIGYFKNNITSITCIYNVGFHSLCEVLIIILYNFR